MTKPFVWILFFALGWSVWGCDDDSPDTLDIEGDPSAGAMLIEGYACGSCHVIPGIPRANGRVGPKLTDYDRRVYVAGVIPNTPGDLSRWIENPPSIDPRTTMPDLGVAPQQARDMATYLYLKTGGM